MEYKQLYAKLQSLMYLLVNFIGRQRRRNHFLSKTINARISLSMSEHIVMCNRNIGFTNRLLQKPGV